ncbi:tRNA (adenosine(37)-N6)-dimethylallyltransferase MiaA, partial [Anaerotignum sp.]|uniref:tRNA (adenosine(37)-N6)-dimethylallyltransferase MiaA n=1 Tax=Anaerotignum sp. TaxID=2039241 RepID=UPI003993E685
MKKPLIIIGGPTACGKTAMSILLAKKIGGEIISADSMQVYRYMDIGTAKVTKEEADGVPHYLIDEFDPDEEYNVMIFQQKARAYMEEIWAKGKIPIVVGGTGFYINALLYDNAFTETDGDDSFRQACYKQAETDGPEVLFQKLLEIDPEYAATTHANNVKRVTRALEYHHMTGQKFSDHNAEQKQKESPYAAAVIILTMERQKLYERIEQRV